MLINNMNRKKVVIILSVVISLLFIGVFNTKEQKEKDLINNNRIEVLQNNTNELNKTNILETKKFKIKKEEFNQAIKINDTNIEKNNEYIFANYRNIKVDGGNLSGNREKKVVVDIGFGDREYYAFTNEYAQLVRVIAKKITLQSDLKENVLSNGRYYLDEANVSGTENSDLDKGHIIADSLGGVANAYNITPQNKELNRHGNQAYMEKLIRDARGCTDFEAIITYPNTTTQIPNRYKFTYTLNGNLITDEFDNVNPDEVNKNTNENIRPNNKVVESITKTQE